MLKLEMKLEKETKGAVRYQELAYDGSVKTIADGAILGTLYIRKAAFPGGVFTPLIEVSIAEK